MPRLSTVLLAFSLMGTSTTVACKKKAPQSDPLPEPAPAPAPDSPVLGSAPTPAPPAPEPKPAPAPEPDEAPDKQLRRALNKLVKEVDSNDIATQRQALTELESLAKSNPDDGLIQLNIGIAQHRLGDLSAARASYEDAKRKDPSLGHAYLYLGVLKEADGDLGGAESLYREGIQRDPENVDIRVGLVSTLRKQGKLDASLDAAREALKINALSPEIYNDVGLAYLERGDLLLAKFMYQKGLALPEGDEKAYLHANLGWTYYRQGELPRATESLKRAVELDGNYVPALVYLARVYMEDRNYADTVDLLERAAVQDPTNHGVQMNLGIAYRGTEQYDKAKAVYGRALELEPGNPDPHFNLGILYGDFLKDYERSIQEFQDYKAGGGKNISTADEYIDSIEREKSRVERKLKREAATKKRDAERKERERLAAEEEKRLAAEEKRLAEEAEKAAKEAERLEQQPATPGDLPGAEPTTPGDAPSQNGTEEQKGEQ